MQFASYPTLVSRFSARHGDVPMPADSAAFKQWCNANTSDAMKLKVEDPELFSILDGTCSSSVLNALLTGSFSPCPPDPSTVAKEAISSEAQALFDQGSALNMTGQLRLASIAPEAFELWKKSHGPKSPDVEQQRMAEAQRQAEVKRVRLASANGFTGRL